MIDRERVEKMTLTGFPQIEIAQRLGCSARQVRRIQEELKVKKENTIKVTPEIEPVLRTYYSMFESGEKTAQRFGVTRQAILKDRTGENENWREGEFL